MTFEGDIEERATPGAAVPSGAWVSPAGEAGLQGIAGPIGPGFTATSTTSNTVGTGSKTFTTQTGLAYTPGARVRVASQGSPTNWMEGVITAYNPSTGVMTVNVDMTNTTPIGGGVGEAPQDSHYYARFNAAWADIAGYWPAPVLPGHLAGLALSNDGTTPTTVLDIAIGSATSDDATTTMILSAAGFVKNCNAAWAVGSGNGAKDTAGALAASTWYHVFLIKRTDTGVTDVLISTSATTPTMPTSYTKKRRIGSIKTNASSQIIGFVQLGDHFLWNGPPVEMAGVALTGSNLAQTLIGVPTGVRVLAEIELYVGPTAGQTIGMVLVSSPDTGTQAVDSPGVINRTAQVSSATGYDLQQIRVRTNSAAQINFICNPSYLASVYVTTIGWYDSRGK